MGAEELPQKIEALVDHLRTKRDQEFALADVASVTEVLIGTMRAYFRSIDTKIYRECRTLSDYISNARKEIASLEPHDLESARIPRAGMELDAIVQQTEEATNTIMESAEAIMAADPADVEAFQAIVQDKIVKIFEACSFQDITGQRISKVVQTLSFVEGRINELRSLLGVSEDDVAAARSVAEQAEPADPLLRGPALEGEGMAQDEIDALINSEASADSPGPDEKKPAKKARKTSPKSPAKNKKKAAASANGRAGKADKAAPAETQPVPDAASASVGQDEIDALFD
ncbi:MAG: chemotaxis protein [Alphaproteobacteria bacterium]|nr:MAG: chemotaxis protein [Alphaproteobacteria bacterium]